MGRCYLKVVSWKPVKKKRKRREDGGRGRHGLQGEGTREEVVGVVVDAEGRSSGCRELPAAPGLASPNCCGIGPSIIYPHWSSHSLLATLEQPLSRSLLVALRSEGLAASMMVVPGGAATAKGRVENGSLETSKVLPNCKATLTPSHKRKRGTCSGLNLLERLRATAGGPLMSAKTMLEVHDQRCRQKLGS